MDLASLRVRVHTGEHGTDVYDNCVPSVLEKRTSCTMFKMLIQVSVRDIRISNVDTFHCEMYNHKYRDRYHFRAIKANAVNFLIEI